MQCSDETEEFEQVGAQESWSTMKNSLYGDPRVSELLNTRVGQYLNSHPFIALTVLVFGTMATVPIGLFLGFAVMTLIATAVGFIFFEVFLLYVGGLTLLFVLSGLGLFSILVSATLSVCYVITSSMVNFYHQCLPRQIEPRGRTECETSRSVKEIQ